MAGYSAQDLRHKRELTELYNFQAVGFSASSEGSGDDTVAAEDERMRFPATFSAELVKRQREWFMTNQLQLGGLANINFAEGAAKFKDFFDIGNRHIDPITRVYYFITKIQFPPDNPLLFRFNLGPRSPLAMTNNYSITLALAYEFMHTVAQANDEYCHFIQCLINLVPKNLTTNVKQHIGFWPFWAAYRYPTLLAATLPQPNLLPHVPKDKPAYKCQTPGCKRRFRHRFLLYEHNSTGGCGLTEQEKSMLNFSKPHTTTHSALRQ
ncbi:hypothetical protein DSO57_1029630 [Entomophthora muscae]|uniref:Uncharacterized protein n=1 Tax=Entomophthora muscae TaxID=34485 RepID=A0ACC2UAX0_9FUNG|nr:hypothetical protein DSO57_1029630 [Entomophthora muscae]